MILKQFLQAVLLGLVLPALAFSMASGAGFRKESFQEKQRTAQVQKIPVLQKDGDVEIMDLENYVINVILGEISPNFHEEAIKAQAVAARTYALRCMEAGAKHEQEAVCTDHRCCQAYREPEVYLESGGTRGELAKVQRVVAETASEVLYYDEALICATYFASSGGTTEDAKEYLYSLSTRQPVHRWQNIEVRLYI